MINTVQVDNNLAVGFVFHNVMEVALESIHEPIQFCITYSTRGLYIGL